MLNNQTKEIYLTIIVPARNEEHHIEKTILGLVSSPHLKRMSFEIIAINDGSHDKTLEKLLELQSQFGSLNIINHENSKGVGFSFLEAVKRANGKYLFMVPGDNENDPTRILEILNEGIAEDLLLSYVINTNQRSQFRRRLSSFYTIFLNKAFGMNLKYYNGTSVYKTDMLRKLEVKSSGFFFTAEILIKLFSTSITHRELGIYLNNVYQAKSSALSWKSFQIVCFDFCRVFNWYYFVRKRDSK